jgi:hypothetical protein
MSAGGKGSKGSVFGRWRDRDPRTGSFMRSMFEMTSDGSGAFAEARRIQVPATGDEADPPADFADTIPEIGRCRSD